MKRISVEGITALAIAVAHARDVVQANDHIDVLWRHWQHCVGAFAIDQVADVGPAQMLQSHILRLAHVVKLRAVASTILTQEEELLSARFGRAVKALSNHKPRCNP